MPSIAKSVPLTVVVLTHNEERNLPDCLASVADWVGEIFVVDSGSTDRTLQIAEKYAAEVVYHPFETHARQWNWALESLPLKNEWVLCIDSDQRVTPQLRDEIVELFRHDDGRRTTEGGGGRRIANFGLRISDFGLWSSRSWEGRRSRVAGEPRGRGVELAEVDGFYIKRRQVFRGRWIKHGGYYPKYLLKLFRRDKVSTDANDLVDHHFYVDGCVAKLNHDMIEDNWKENDISFWIEKHNRYASLLASEEFERRRNGRQELMEPSLAGNPDQRTLWLKRQWSRMPLYVRPFLYFLYRYIFRLGFLDGKEGFVFHFLQGFWFRLLVDIKLEEIANADKRR